MSVSYDVIRQMFCMVSGQVITDEEIDGLVKSDVLVVDTNKIGNAKKDTEQMLASLVLATTIDYVPRKSKFQERLDLMKKQNGL
jgi:hypothetical protein